MFIKRVGFEPHDKSSVRDRLETYGSQKMWQKLFSHRQTSHSKSAASLDDTREGLDISCENNAASNAGNSLIARLLPNLRCSP
jgi:hypothetical protein